MILLPYTEVALVLVTMHESVCFLAIANGRCVTIRHKLNVANHWNLGFVGVDRVCANNRMCCIVKQTIDLSSRQTWK